MLEDLMPYVPREMDGDVYQPGVLFERSASLLERSVETGISQMANFNFRDVVNIRGLVTEIIGCTLFEQVMETKLHGNISGELKRGKNDYVINHNDRFLIKRDSSNRIYILERGNNDSSDGKHGYKVKSELDGIYEMVVNSPREKIKFPIPIEVKSGKIDLDVDHIVNDILEPIDEIWGVCPCYVLIGFREEMYVRGSTNKLRKNLAQIYFDLKQRGFQLIPIHMPYPKERMATYANEISQRFSGVKSFRAELDLRSDMIELTDLFGNVRRGRFVEDSS